MAWAATRWLVRVGVRIVEWSLSFDFADRLATPVENIADAYQTQVVHRLGLAPFLLLWPPAGAPFRRFGAADGGT